MAYFDWNDSLSVKINSIDKQHKILVDMINEFYENIKSQSSSDALKKLVKQLKNYTVTHFSYEERLFERYGYPEIISHKLEHQKFIDKIKELENKLATGKMVLSFEITDYLKNWLLEHIKGTDQKYSGFLVDKGAI